MFLLKFKHLHKYIFSLLRNISNHNKNISFASVLFAIERSISIVLSSNYLKNINILTKFNFNNGSYINLFRILYINNIFQKNNYNNITRIPSSLLFSSNFLNIFAKDSILKELNFLYYINNNDISLFRKILLKKIRDLKKRRIIKLYIPKIGNLLYGTVMELFNGGCIIKLGIDYGFLNIKNSLEKDNHKTKDDICIYLEKIDARSHSCFLILSRIHKNFVYQLLKKNITNIYSNTIMIKNISRNPNFKTQIAVHSINNQIDSVSSCIGSQGLIIKSIMQEIKNEKIDIIKWNNNIISFFFNSMFLKIRILKIFFINSNNLNVIIHSCDKTYTIGKSKSNIKLISDLILYKLNIITEEYEYIKKKEEYIDINLLFTKSLNIDTNLSQVLISEGFIDINSLIFVNLFFLYKIQYIGFSTACELIFRSKNCLYNL